MFRFLFSIFLLGLALSVTRLAAQTYEFGTISLGNERINVASMAFDAAGNLYFTDRDHTIRRFSADGILSTVAGQPNITGASDGTSTAARFFAPQGIAVDATNNLYVADYGNHTVRKITPAGVVTTLAGLAGSPGFADGRGSVARLQNPRSLALDAAGNLYIGQMYAIRKLTPEGVVSTLAGAPAPVPGVPDLAPRLGYDISNVVLDASGNIYFTSSGQGIIGKVTPAGVVTTLAGAMNQNGHADGTGPAARFKNPTGLVLEANGDLIVADSDTRTLRRVTPAGAVATIAGQIDRGSMVDGLGGRALFANPTRLARSPSGTLYLIDGYDGATLRRGTPSAALQPPIIHTISPVDDVALGARATATFSIGVAGTPPFTFRWHRVLYGGVLPEATGSTLTLPSVSSADSDYYAVTVTNAAGSSSATFTLRVYTPAIESLRSRHATPGGSFLWSIASGGGQLVTVGTQGTILTSSDGTSWARRNSGTSEWLVGVTYGAGKFVAVGENGRVLLSTDGVIWTRAAQTNTVQRLNNVIYARNLFVAVGEAGTIITSPDGQTWTLRTSGVTQWLRGLAYNGTSLGVGQYVATGEDAAVLTSSDGVIWQKRLLQWSSGDIEALVSTGSYTDFVGVGEDGALLNIHTQTLSSLIVPRIYGLNLSVHRTGLGGRLRGLALGANNLFLTGENGMVLAGSSPEGPWAEIPSGTNANLVGGAFHGNTLFIVGEDETILQSGPYYKSRLTNLSTRANVGTDDGAMISGFVIDGSTPKRVLVRAAGPALATFGLGNTLARPVLTLFDDIGQTLATNAGWSTDRDADAIAATARRVGAFPFAQGSGDSALLLTLPPGSYTARVSSENGALGVSLLEAYDAELLATEGSRAINISTRGQVGAGANRLIAGVVLSGAASRRVLIRAVGPSLAGFGLSGTLAAPQIEIYDNNGLRLVTAGAWSTQFKADEIRSAALLTGAFPLQEGSQDAATLVILAPGSYTIQVSGLNDTTGLALVEVYDLP